MEGEQVRVVERGGKARAERSGVVKCESGRGGAGDIGALRAAGGDGGLDGGDELFGLVGQQIEVEAAAGVREARDEGGDGVALGIGERAGLGGLEEGLEAGLGVGDGVGARGAGGRDSGGSAGRGVGLGFETGEEVDDI